MAIFKFTFSVVGGDIAELPVTITTTFPVELTFTGGPQIIAFDVENILDRAVTIENIVASVVTGDSTLVDISLLDTIISFLPLETKSSTLTITPNQEIIEGTTLIIEVSGSEL